VYDIDFMRLFVNPNPHPNPAQSLHLTWKEAPWYFHLIHSTLDEERKVAGIHHHVVEHKHPLYHLVAYTAGENACTVEGEEIPFKRGTLVLVSPGQLHDFSPRKMGRARYSELTFSFMNPEGVPLAIPVHEVLSLWAGSAISNNRSLNLGENQLVRFSGLLDETQKRHSAGSPRNAHVALEPVSALFGFLATLLNAEGEEARTDDVIETVRQHIEAHLTEAVRIDELAALTGRSGESLIRGFRKIHGLPPIAWQHARRVESAAILLGSTNLSCAEIADRLGYTDVHHFSRMFKKIRGIPPTALRKTRNIH